MKHLKILSPFLFLTVFLGTQTVAQCTDVHDVDNIPVGLATYETEIPKPGPSTLPDANGVKKYIGAVAELNQNTRFKIVLKTDLNSAFNKHNDYVVFEVADDVMTVVDILPVTTADSNGLHPEDPKGFNPKKRCTVIPKGTRLYGLVDRSKSKTFFGIGGRAKLFVYVRDVVLPDGKAVAISFAEPEGTQIDDDKAKASIRECKIESKTMCIFGRRSAFTYTLPKSAVAAGVKGYYDARFGDTSASVRNAKIYTGLAFFDTLFSNSLLGEAIKPNESTLKAEMIFDVKTVGSLKVWVSLAPAEKKKDDATSKD